ncbi:TonB-dependent receptor [Bernardetia sp. MNP-M8]|uniref:TonB-dependent receptor n=1 Tax=Bernardetia sp. MNP-M8 TaxID=3127470 RepID=UPI0030CD9A07
MSSKSILKEFFLSLCLSFQTVKKTSFLILLLVACFFSIPVFSQTPTTNSTTKKHTISGFVREVESSETLIGVSIYNPKTKQGTVTNSYGFYSLTLQEDTVSLIYSYIGYEAQAHQIILDKDINLDISLDFDEALEAVVIVADKDSEPISEQVQMSQVSIPVEQIKDIPALLGEKDVIKALQLLPGVQGGTEGSSGLYVRGGNNDQNLILLDEAPVYNASHLFGFFSVFNGDAIKQVELTKGGFPARYGGRLSSVLDMRLKEGNKNKVSGEGGIGLISSRLLLEVPVVKDKSSFIISGRRTYIDILTRPLMPKDFTVGYYFYDLNAKFNYDFSRKDKLFVSGYFGRDKFYARDNYSSNNQNESFESGINWGNATTTVRWNHLYNNKLFSNISLIFSDYKFQIFSEDNYDNENYYLKYTSNIRDYSLKYDWTYYPSPSHTVRFGMQSTLHRFTPSAFVIKEPDFEYDPSRNTKYDVIESAIYVEDDWQITDKFRVNAGLRLSNLLDVSTKNKDEENKSYHGIEPRIAAAYRLTSTLALKGSYALMNQYIHQLSNTGIGLPTDLWVPSTARVQPQQSQQVAAGIAKDFKETGLTLSVESYYKISKDVIGYKEGANFLLIDDPYSSESFDWQDAITRGKGRAYGLEILLQKKKGKFTGWVGYTLAKTEQQFDDLNNSKWFSPRFDIRHDFSITGSYKINDKINLSANWVFRTGAPVTMPKNSFNPFTHSPNVEGVNNYNFISSVANYGEKNSFRMQNYNRLDIAAQFKKEKKWGVRTWEVGVYNAYSRMNPFFYILNSQNEAGENVETVQKVALFPIIPSITYNFKF